jgi:hypothetical protein
VGHDIACTAGMKQMQLAKQIPFVQVAVLEPERHRAKLSQ